MCSIHNAVTSIPMNVTALADSGASIGAATFRRRNLFIVIRVQARVVGVSCVMPALPIVSIVVAKPAVPYCNSPDGRAALGQEVPK
jgi:hypothetical protein